jgi:heme-degrading monooxygenase HmoA
MIARIWRGVTLDSKGEQYLDYLKRTNVKDCRATAGNRGVWVLRKLVNGRAEFLFISLWESFDAIRKFAGEETEKAVYYPEDEEFLLGLDANVAHYEVMVESGALFSNP